MKRRAFLNQTMKVGVGTLLPFGLAWNHSFANQIHEESPVSRFFKISLNQWSLFNNYVGDMGRDGWWSDFILDLKSDPSHVLQGELDPIEFPVLARKEFDLDAIEIEASLYFAQIDNQQYFNEFKSRCEDNGVKCLLISNGWSGNLTNLEGTKPKEVAKNYYKWVDLCAFLGCHSLMVDVTGRRGDKQAVKEAAIEGVGTLTEYAEKSGINIICENHNWYSADPVWLTDIIKGVNSPFCNLNVDLLNFCQQGWKNNECQGQIDPYVATSILMPYAKAVSAKSLAFDKDGYETTIDYHKMLTIIRDFGYTGYLGIEFSGYGPNIEGIHKTIKMLNLVANQI